MTDAERRQRIADVRAQEERTMQPRFWYLSFADETSFRGAVIVYARGVTNAIARTHALGLNPGGEVLGFEIPRDTGVPSEAVNRLLSKAEIERLIGGGKTVRELAESGDPEQIALARRILEGS